jgi:hypothetical protein
MISGIGIILFVFIGVTDIIFTILRSYMSSCVRFFEQNCVYLVNFESKFK